LPWKASVSNYRDSPRE